MEVSEEIDGFINVAVVDQFGDGTFYVVPVGAEGFDDCGDDEAFDVGAGCVVRTEGVAFFGVEGAFEESAEDGGLYFAPVGVSGVDEKGELITGERERRYLRRGPR
jgi:hypothetical protein